MLDIIVTTNLEFSRWTELVESEIMEPHLLTEVHFDPIFSRYECKGLLPTITTKQGGSKRAVYDQNSMDEIKERENVEIVVRLLSYTKTLEEMVIELRNKINELMPKGQ